MFDLGDQDASAGLPLGGGPGAEGAGASTQEGMAEEPVYIFDPEGWCRWVNDAGAALLDMDPGRIVGRYIFELFPAQYRSQIAAWRRVIASKRPSTYLSEISVRGETSLYQTSLLPVMDRSGKVRSIVCVGHKFTERDSPQYEQYVQGIELAALQEMAQALTAGLRGHAFYGRVARAIGRLVDFDALALLALDASGSLTVVFATEALAEAQELKESLTVEGSGLTWALEARRPYIEGDLGQRPGRGLPGLLAQRGFRSLMALPLVTARGVIGLALLTAYKAGAFGSPESIAAERLAPHVALAVESVYQAEESQALRRQLEEVRERMERAERLSALGQSVSRVAHDFNNLLSVILGRAQLLRRQLPEGPYMEDLRVMEQAARDAAEVVRRVLDYSRGASGPAFTAVDVRSLVHDVIEMTRFKWEDEARRRGQTIEVVSRIGDVPDVLGDYVELREVLTNVVVNACEAIEQQGRVEVAAYPSRDREQVHISVTDTGVGMPPEVVKRAFEPFFTTKGSRGTGLGLSIVREIVARHGGSVDVHSQPGAGTTILVSLPAIPSLSRRGGGDDVRRHAVRRRLRVLVIEDDPTIKTVLGDILSLADCEVSVASDGQEGLALLGRHRFDVVFTDLTMPGLSGWQVARAVKELRAETAVVLVTGWGADIDVQELEARGVDRVLTKPFEMEEVMDLLTAFMR